MPKKRESLSTAYPEIAAQADGWEPSEVPAFSHRELPWRCPVGHVYECRVDYRARGRGCPICAGKRIQVGVNDFATTDPDLAAQAHGWDPTTVTRGSGKKMLWVCLRGHVWMCEVAQRKRLDECAVCSGKKVLVGVNDLATTDPDLAAQAHGWDPTTVTRGSGKKMLWWCAEGHSYEAAVSQLVRGRRCGVCAGRQLLAGVNDLRSCYPDVALEADGWDPSLVRHGSSQKLPWRCRKDHRWIAAVSNRTRLGAGCPACAGNILVVGVNDVATKHPELAVEADGWDPSAVAMGSSLKMPWVCQKGHRWTAAVTSRTRSGCPYCAGKVPIVGQDDLASTHPDLAVEADGWDPKTLKAGSNKKVGWECKLGHKWKSVVHSRALEGIGCPICSGRKVLVGFNDLATTDPDLATEADGWDPRTLTRSSNKKVGWKCKLGHTWIAVVGNRTIGRNCPVCAGKVVAAGFNDLLTTHPALAAEADGWDPATVSKGNNRPSRWWRCPNGHRWKATVNNRSKGSGCPTCAPSGYDPSLPGWLYLIEHDDLDMFQIGISNFPEKRLGDHARRGWEFLEIRGPMDGLLAQQLETTMLRSLEQRGAVFGHKAQIEKFDGYSEAWIKDSLKVTGLKELLDWINHDEN